MPVTREFKQTFSGGEVSPEMFGRIGDQKFQQGAAKIRNFIVKPQGPAQNRPGFAFVSEVKDSSKQTRLLSFTFSTVQTMIIEFGDQYFRFHTQGQTLQYSQGTAWNSATAYTVGDIALQGGVNYYCTVAHTNQVPPNAAYWYAMPTDYTYEVPSPYLEAELFDVHYVQSADVMTLVHPNHPPKELRRLSATKWELKTIDFGSPLPAPTGVSVARYIPSSSSTNSDTYQDRTYVVTAIGTNLVEESNQSASATKTNNIFVTGAKNTITWNAVTGATRYRVYKEQGGIFGFLGETTTTTMVDDNIATDFSRTPPIHENDFVGTGNYPGAVSYFEQRRVFAGTNNAPQDIWMTKTGTESNMSFGLPIKDDDRIEFRVAAREANTIRHIVPLTQLLLLTGSAEWRVTSINSDAITPSSISVKPQSYIGSNNTQPVIVNNSLVYAAARGGHVRELGYNWQANGFITGDLSLRAPHLFDNLTTKDMALSKAPIPIVWMVSSNGKLLGLTYVPEQQLGAWHQHDTDGLFESVACVSEGNDDVTYCVIQRTIGGSTKRYIERMGTRLFPTQRDSFFVDAGATYNGINTDTNRLVTIGGSFVPGNTVSITTNFNVFNPPPSLDDKDDAIVIVDGNNRYRITITSTVSATQATGIPDKTIPMNLRNAPTNNFEIARILGQRRLCNFTTL